MLDFSKLKEFADDNFKFDGNGRKLSKWVENTVGKGEIACYEQFPLSPVFSKGLFPRGVKRCHCVGMGWTTLDAPYEKCFENNVGKGENVGIQLFSFFHNVFYCMIDKSNVWTRLKCCCLGKG